jgi:hypothetical protein
LQLMEVSVIPLFGEFSLKNHFTHTFCWCKYSVLTIVQA